VKKQREKGFLVLEILIAGLILTASIAATMYLFQLGYGYLEKTRTSNVMSSKLIQATGLFKTLELDRQSGMEDIGDGVKLKWKSRILSTSIPKVGGSEIAAQNVYELFIYRIDFTMLYRGMDRDYQINVFRYKSLSSSNKISH
jgi:hypothetical protein